MSDPQLLDAVLGVPADVMAQVMGDEVVLLDLATGSYFGLEGVGASLWQLVDGQRTLRDICERLLQEFEVERSELEGDLLPLAGKLIERGLLTRVG